MNTRLSSILIAAGLWALGGVAQAGECGDVSIAEFNWDSGGIAAHVDKIILENGYGCNVTLMVGGTTPIFLSMNEKAEPDIAPELWINAIGAPLEKAFEEGRLIKLTPILSEGGMEGWWIPKFIADAHPDIKTVQDALKHPELFPAPSDSSRGAIMNCPTGWQCEASTSNLYRAIGAEEKGFDLVDTGSGAGLAGSIASAFEKQSGWLGYYWSPTTILGRYDMVKLPFDVPHDVEEWNNCTTQLDCLDPKVNSYVATPVYTVVTKEFVERDAILLDYLKKRQWDNQTISKILAWKDENQATSEDAAYHLLETLPDMWTGWVDPAVAAKVKKAL